MLRTIYDINPARLNSIMPTLQRMEDDPSFLEYRERRFEQDEPPPPYSSRSTTRESSPELLPQTQGDIDLEELVRKPLSDHEINVIRGKLVGRYYPRERYDNEVSQEWQRIDAARWRRNGDHVPDRGADLDWRAEHLRQNIIIRHNIKKRWEKLGVWNPEWGIPTGTTCYRGIQAFRNNDGPDTWEWQRKWRGTERKFTGLPYEEKMASWPSQDEESPYERAIRVYLKGQGRWSETLKLQSSEAPNKYDTDVVDHRESLITTRPWFVWALEVAEEEVRLQRNPNQSMIEAYKPARVNVQARWKEKGYWKDSWSNVMPPGWSGGWRDMPGWKWRHESSSPEPADPNDMEFTPSEVDALEAIRPATPSPPPEPSSLEHRVPTGRSIFDPDYEPDPQPSTSTEHIPKPQAGGDGDHADNRPETMAGDIGNEPPQSLVEIDVRMAPRAERETQRLLRSNTRPSRSTARFDMPSPAPQKTRQRQRVSRAPTKSSKISKPTPPRRSLRIAEREARLKGADVPSEAVENLNKDRVMKQPQRDQQVQETLARTKSRKNGPLKKGHLPKPSKPQGVAKRRGRRRHLDG
ncbi:hypothetical protein AYL99_01141 [Fonsecaea erecta]|uniref:Uncharacterized protein n=1 Tax=Fonsecaea erecta TaxID=1367422 RepID=A0A178ZZD0_9EURO|nr:hypothetical protein AYL99_01141 [Fonsecaea erecta]OAP65169.1 hypothetical protein AYL99_01141 [Fonsecaea erecta]